MAFVKITIRVVQHKNQRYDTCGDWYDNGKDIRIKVSNLDNWRFNALVGFHEFIEALCCRSSGITEQMVTDFDLEFEGKRVKDNTDEPGDDPNAPYRKQHQFATKLERELAAELGVDWKEYEEAISSL